MARGPAADGLSWLNGAERGEAQAALRACCGSAKFAEELCALRPFESLEQALEAAATVWWNQVGIGGWLEAFAAHPRIGDVAGLREKFAATSTWCEGEQSAALTSADDQTLEELARHNRMYEERFGHVFLICATGRPAGDVLAALKARYPNRPIVELQVAAAEQHKITELRLNKLLRERAAAATAAGGAPPSAAQSESAPEAAAARTSQGAAYAATVRRLRQVGDHVAAALQLAPPAAATSQPPHAAARGSTGGPPPLRPPVTTHVLDIAAGRPAGGLPVTLSVRSGEGSAPPGGGGAMWTRVGASVTDGDGRSGPLMAPAASVRPGAYSLAFETGRYFEETTGKRGFYPRVTVEFEIREEQAGEHFHVPVLLAPFSYSTYRGS